MKTIEEAIMATDLDTMAEVAMNDPGRKARIEARIQKDRKAAQARANRQKVDRRATTATATALALLAGYALALL